MFQAFSANLTFLIAVSALKGGKGGFVYIFLFKLIEFFNTKNLLNDNHQRFNLKKFGNFLGYHPLQRDLFKQEFLLSIFI